MDIKYLNLATHIESAKPCYLISSDSVSVASFNSPGTRASYVRSDCFTRLTNVLGLEELCSQVSSVSTFLYSGHALDWSNCIELARSGNRSFAGGNVDSREFLNLAGFTEHDIGALLRMHGRSQKGMYCLLYSREFFAAIENLPDFVEEDDLRKMREIEWRPHPLLTLEGFRFSGKFL